MQERHEPNQPIALATANIVEVDGLPVQTPARVALRLLPRPTVTIEADSLPNTVLVKERFQIRLDNGAELETMVLASKFGTSQRSLIPPLQPINVIDKGLPLKKVNFGLLNFPIMYGSQCIWVEEAHGYSAIPHSKMVVADWCVEITGLVNVSDVVKELQQHSGYGLTYTGSITHNDNGNISVRNAEQLLEALRAFLSFVRGAASSPTLVEGKGQDGQRSWLRWGAHHVEPWMNLSSWFRTSNGADILSDLFPKFWSLLETDEERKSSILRSVDWYLQSNVSPPHVGIILTVAALERLSFQVLGRERSEPMGEYISQALEKIRTPLHIPNGYRSLTQVDSWKHGPHAIVGIRNDLTHPKQRYSPVSDIAIHEAWNLGQWYIEMIMLYMLTFRGKYMNRLADRGQQAEALVPVPWVEKT